MRAGIQNNRLDKSSIIVKYQIRSAYLLQVYQHGLKHECSGYTSRSIRQLVPTNNMVEIYMNNPILRSGNVCTIYMSKNFNAKPEDVVIWQAN